MNIFSKTSLTLALMATCGAMADATPSRNVREDEGDGGRKLLFGRNAIRVVIRTNFRGDENGDARKLSHAEMSTFRGDENGDDGAVLYGRLKVVSYLPIMGDQTCETTVAMRAAMVASCFCLI
jgi:hypothetical protein